MIQNKFRNGALTFSVVEQGEGTPVILLHGFPDHARTFRLQLPALAAAGYRAMAPTMRGYEPSSQPKDGDYRLERLAEDVLAFIEQSGRERVHLVGHDWGAVVSYWVAAMAPDRLLSLTTLAIPTPGRLVSHGLRALPQQILKSWYILFFQLPLVSDFVVEFRDWAFVEWLWRRWSPDWRLPEAEMQALKSSLRQPGVKRAALGYYRALLDRHSVREARATVRLLKKTIQVPTLALTGENDGCMDTRLHDILMKPADFPAGLEIMRVSGAGHFLQQERPELINQKLIEHFKASERRTL
ncbi:MAG TPA: alpha/beta hydrolase [Oligoflexus sp.]|uniref:alpha/beta fold hydrolase n=1 Tax=Oligoflexus sp. TaxID=1971216 RepID=UPI002D7EC7BF|nr:alpha/beta hydrolase [Oligoflexus sp.]HET9236596.1 alpha/beta hydrolase [Oligoflexus sp.]